MSQPHSGDTTVCVVYSYMYVRLHARIYKPHLHTPIQLE